MSGILVISLDFELMWGVRDRRSVAEYGDAVLGGRRAIPEILNRFNRAGLRATWATVGLLFARNRTEMLDHAPVVRPHYINATLSPYQVIESAIGENENQDPLHFGRSLLDRILDSRGQEIATHTYSHYYCMEPGQTLETFRADLDAAVTIAVESGLSVDSIVFPRNQMTADHLATCMSAGITAYRGNPHSKYYRARSDAELNWFVRAGRLLDSLVPLDGMHGHVLASRDQDGVNIPSSRFFRMFSRKNDLLMKLAIQRIKSEMTHAARNGRLYHLWWHPHNFGRDTEYCLAQLDEILRHFKVLEMQYGMVSKTMRDVARSGFSA